MRFVRLSLAALSIALFSICGLSSCVLPLASTDQNCVSYCTLLQGCGVASAPTSECNAWCTAFADTLDHVGCKAEFDDAAACAVGDSSCLAESCSAETQAYVDCSTQFCTMNPTDDACVDS